MALVINRVPLLIFRKRIFVIHDNIVYILFINYYAAVFQKEASDFPLPHHESAAELR